MTMVDQINFAHLNAHSITSEHTYSNIFTMVTKCTFDVIVVFETHSTPKKLYPKVEVIYNHAKNAKAVVCIMYHRGLLKIEKTCNFYPAHATYVDFNLGKTEYRLIAVNETYGDNLTFFSEKIFEKEIFNTSKHIIAIGDWNLGLFPQFDYFNYCNAKNYKAESRSQIIAGIKEFTQRKASRSKPNLQTGPLDLEMQK